jgi:predicted RNA-binding Zn ribbon-like protein
LSRERNPAPHLIGGHDALDLVNTVSWRTDARRWRDNLTDCGALLRWCQHANLVGEAKARELLTASKERHVQEKVLNDTRRLREQVHTVLAPFAEHLTPSDPVVVPPGLHTLFLEALAHSDLTGVPLRWQLTPRTPDDISRLLALRTLDLLQSSQLHLIRRCEGPGCGWLFLDRTRNHTRRWCSSGDCGNRDRARRHYARKTQLRRVDLANRPS